MLWRRRRPTINNGTDTCDPDASGSALSLLRYWLGVAAHALEQRPGEYGQCHVVPTLRGWDPHLDRWRQPMAFDAGPTRDEARSTCAARAQTLPTMAALPEVVTPAPVAA